MPSKTEAIERRRQLVAGLALGLCAAAVTAVPEVWQKLALGIALIAVPFGSWVLAEPGRWVLLFLCAAVLLPPLPFPLGDTGPHPALALAALGGVAGVLYIGRWRVPATLPNLCFAGYLFALLASLAFAAAYSGLATAALSLARTLLFGIAVYLFFYVAHGPDRFTAPDRGWKELRLLLAGATGAALFACLDFYFQFPAPAGFGAQFVWLESGVYRRAQGLFYEASTLGNFCVFFLLGIAVLLLRPEKRAKAPRLLLAAAGVVFLVALMLSYSRASVVNLAVGLTLLLWLERRRVHWRQFLPVLAASLPAAWFAGSRLFPELSETYQVRLFGWIEHLAAARWDTLSGRLESWRQLASFFAERPWHAFIGVGYKTLPYSSFTGAQVVADNAYISAFAETGIIGLAAMLAFNIAVLYLSWRAVRADSPEARFFGTWILCFWTGQMIQMLSGDLLTYWRVLPLYLWALAISVRHTEPA